MYTTRNFKTKKELKEAVAAHGACCAFDRECDKAVRLFAPGLGTLKTNGTEYVEGPHYPAPHRWYAQVEVKDGIVVKVK
jgi:hypothetical protein